MGTNCQVPGKASALERPERRKASQGERPGEATPQASLPAGETCPVPEHVNGLTGHKTLKIAQDQLKLKFARVFTSWDRHNKSGGFKQKLSHGSGSLKSEIKVST